MIRHEGKRIFVRYDGAETRVDIHRAKEGKSLTKKELATLVAVLAEALAKRRRFDGDQRRFRGYAVRNEAGLWLGIHTPDDRENAAYSFGSVANRMKWTDLQDALIEAEGCDAVRDGETDFFAVPIFAVRKRKALVSK